MLVQIAPAFSIGILATLNPCVLPLYPGFLSYLAANAKKLKRQRGIRLLGLFVLAGVLTMMLLLGALIAALNVSAGRVLAIVTPVADLVVVSLGILLLMGRNPFARLPQIQFRSGGESPFLNAYLYGLLYGPIALPCSGPLVISLFALSFSAQGFLTQLLFFLVFGLGFGLPLLAISLLARSRQQWVLNQFTKHYRLISRLSGVLLIIVGTWDFFVNWSAIRLFLGL